MKQSFPYKMKEFHIDRKFLLFLRDVLLRYSWIILVKYAIFYLLRPFLPNYKHILQKNIYLEYNIKRINPTVKVFFSIICHFLTPIHEILDFNTIPSPGDRKALKCCF